MASRSHLALLALAALPAAAAAQAPFPLEPGGDSRHSDSAASFDGTNFLVAFEDDRGIPFNRELYGMFVSPAGQPLTPFAQMISSGPYTGYPDACFGAGQHFVAFEGAWGGGIVPQIICTRILPDGTVLDPDGIAVFSNQQTGHAFRPQVASNGQKFCIVWGDDLLQAGEKPLQFAIVNSSGAIEVGPVSIPGTDLASPFSTDLTSDGTNFFLAWESGSGVMLTRISPAGAVLGTTMVHSIGNYFTQEIKIGFNGDSLLVSWYWSPNGTPALVAKRASISGSPTGSLITIPGPWFIPISIVRSGSDFLLFVNGSDPSSQGTLGYARISSAGVITQPPTMYLPGGTPGISGRPSMAMGAGGTLLSAVSFANSTFEPARMIGQILQFGPPPCYANCDESQAAPVLNVADFSCFLSRFAAGEVYANCDQSTAPPALNVNDFSCFLTKFAAGCP